MALVDYRKVYDDYIRIKHLLLDAHQGDETVPSPERTLKDLGANVDVKYKHLRVRFDKPVYESMNTATLRYSEMKKTLLSEYEFLKQRLMFDPRSKLSSEDKQRFHEITRSINTLDQTLAEYARLFQVTKQTLERDQRALLTSMSAQESKRNALYDEIQTYTKDNIARKETITRYIKGSMDYGSAAAVNPNDSLRQFRDLVNTTCTFLITPPRIEKAADDTTPDTTRKQDVRLMRMDNRIKETLKQAVKMKRKTDTLLQIPIPTSDTIKDSLKKMLFTTLDECMSNKPTKPYYMNKENILKILKKDPRLSQKVASYLSKLSKKELCEKIMS